MSGETHRFSTDVAIVGGGPVGASLALALQGSGLRVTVLEARRRPPGGDPRALALSYGSRLILERLGVWRRIAAATPIETVHVSQRGGFGRTVLRAEDSGGDALGYVVDYADLTAALQTGLTDAGVDCRVGAEVTAVTPERGGVTTAFIQHHRAGEAQSALLALADGGRLLERLPAFEQHIHDYRQHAIVARVTTNRPHRQCAYERFTPQGPVALLPAGDAWALVWTVVREEADPLLRLDETTFLAALQQRFGGRAGAFLTVGARTAFPLYRKQTRPVAIGHMAVIGNAAQVLHPFAGQGFNLGLRDAWTLADEIRRAAAGELGAPAMLDRYRRRRILDARGGAALTDALVKLFLGDIPSLQWARGLGLAALDWLPGAKPFLLRRFIHGMG